MRFKSISYARGSTSSQFDQGQREEKHTLLHPSSANTLRPALPRTPLSCLSSGPLAWLMMTRPQEAGKTAIPSVLPVARSDSLPHDLHSRSLSRSLSRRTTRKRYRSHPLTIERRIRSFDGGQQSRRCLEGKNRLRGRWCGNECLGRARWCCCRRV